MFLRNIIKETPNFCTRIPWTEAIHMRSVVYICSVLRIVRRGAGAVALPLQLADPRGN